MNSMMWNEAAKHAATRQSMQLPPCPAKVVAPTAAASSSIFEQTMLLNRLTEAEAQLASSNNDMVIDKPVKPVAGSSKHPNDQEFVMDSELLY